MALVDLWTGTPNQLLGKTIQQVIAFAGDGKLKDGNETCQEFRSLLQIIPVDDLCRYSSECLETSFENSGLALQDVINQAGRRLGFNVVDGRYRGKVNAIGFDGLWSAPDGHKILIEVKTTDAYRISLDTIAEYRRRLIENGEMTENESSILIVVGRKDTGDLEAQIRGSRYAWDIRLISVDALFRLVRIREEIEGPTTAKKICDILKPQEFTRVDGIIDLVFEAAADVISPEPEVITIETMPAKSAQQEKQTKFTPVSFHGDCIERIKKHLGIQLVKRTRATFISPTGDTAVVCAVSREHAYSDEEKGYWFAFHPHQRETLKSMQNAYVAFGCGGPENIVLIPFQLFEPWLDGMNMTRKEDREYWHVHIGQTEQKVTLYRRADMDPVDLTLYVLPSMSL